MDIVLYIYIGESRCNHRNMYFYLREPPELKTDQAYATFSAIAATMSARDIKFDANNDCCGFQGVSEFCRLPYWRPVTNSVLDLAHIMKGCMKHAILMMKGTWNLKEHKRTGKEKDDDSDVGLRAEIKRRIAALKVTEEKQQASDALFA